MEATIDKAVERVAKINLMPQIMANTALAYGGGSLVMDETIIDADVVKAVKEKSGNFKWPFPRRHEYFPPGF